jgi:hypothetical protein
MRGRTVHPEATQAITLIPLKEHCEQCGLPLWVGYHSHRILTRLDGLWKLTTVVRRCVHATTRPRDGLPRLVV